MKTKFYRIISLLTILVIMCTTISFPAHAETHTLNNPWKNVNNYITWDCVYFGSYDQNGTGEKTRIKWRVLEVNGNDAFIMADKALDVYPYYDNDSYFYTNVTWKNSSVRAWLNSTFINNAFSIGEQSAIIETNIKTTSYDSNKFSETTNDKVYLLSVDECKNTKYGFQSDIILKDNSRACKITEKARCDSNRLLKNAKVCTWMLRTVCDDNSNICTRERCIGTMGELSSGLLYEHYAAIRPVLHLNINSDNWQYAGRVTSAPDNVIDDEKTIDYKKYKEDAEKEGVLNVRVCDDEFLKDSISEYNNDIARYAIGLSTLVYADTTAIVNGLKKLGFDDENTSENEYLPESVKLIIS